jgi:hypothetical protein
MGENIENIHWLASAFVYILKRTAVAPLLECRLGRFTRMYMGPVGGGTAAPPLTSSGGLSLMRAMHGIAVTLVEFHHLCSTGRTPNGLAQLDALLGLLTNWLNVYYDFTVFLTSSSMLQCLCSLSLRREAHGSKRMFLELIHGLFIT